jgi:hypothetical protein
MALRSRKELLARRRVVKGYDERLTSALDDFVDTRLLSAAVHVGVGDERQLTAARGVAAKVGAAVHRPLERVTVPSEHVIGVLSKPSPIICVRT